MARRLIDISVPLENDVASDPPGYLPKIEYLDHKSSLPELLRVFPGLKENDLPDGYVATAHDVEAELERIGHRLRPLEIVVVNTAAGARYGSRNYVNSGCGMGREATLYLLERGVRVTGTDAWSWDAPFVYTAGRYLKTRNAGLIWEGHKAGREIGYCHLEKLHNLEALPAEGFRVCCFPFKIRDASAGWTRAVAIVDEGDRDAKE